MMRTKLTLLLWLCCTAVYAQLAPEPAAQPTNLHKSGTDKAFVMDVSFDAATGANAYLVLRSTQPITGVPVDGVAYTKGQGVGNAKVFSTSNATFLRIKELGA